MKNIIKATIALATAFTMVFISVPVSIFASQQVPVDFVYDPTYTELETSADGTVAIKTSVGQSIGISVSDTTLPFSITPHVNGNGKLNELSGTSWIYNVTDIASGDENYLTLSFTKETLSNSGDSSYENYNIPSGYATKTINMNVADTLTVAITSTAHVSDFEHITATVGDSGYIVPKILPSAYGHDLINNQEITYESSNLPVISLNGNEWTALAAGESIITITIPDGLGNFITKTQTIDVVSHQKIPVQGQLIDASTDKPIGISNVKIYGKVNSADPYTQIATTNENGSFSFKLPVGQEMSLFSESPKPGYYNPSYVTTVKGTPIVYLHVSLEGENSIAVIGNVSDSNGNPKQNVEVDIMSTTRDDYGFSTKTDTNGNYCLVIDNNDDYNLSISNPETSIYESPVKINIPATNENVTDANFTLELKT